ncbi:MAG: hypothetical protein ACNA8W_03380 [Bradymonadaceae bacterium]
MRRISCLSFIFLMSLFCSTASAQEVSPASLLQPSEEHLLRGDLYYYGGDYYRAITEYKTFLLLQAHDPRSKRIELKMAWLYHRAGENREAAQLLSGITSTDADSLGWWSRYYMGMTAMSAGRQDLARRAFDEVIDFCAPMAAEISTRSDEPQVADCYQLLIETRLALADYHTVRHDFDQAAFQLEQMPAEWANAGEAAQIAELVRGIPIPRKSPALAGTLSIVPGFGHFYLGEYGTGVLAMVWNGVFIYAIVDSILSRNYGQAALIGLIESIWYGGTIFGAISGAHRYNRDAKRIVESGLRQDISEFRQIEPWPARFPVSYPAQLELKMDF